MNIVSYSYHIEFEDQQRVLTLYKSTGVQ